MVTSQPDQNKIQKPNLTAVQIYSSEVRKSEETDKGKRKVAEMNSLSQADDELRGCAET